jgi:predicted dehydrogenase
VRSNLEAFAKAVRGVQPYPVSRAEMLANVAALEAIMQSVQRRVLVPVAAATTAA